MQIVIKSYKTHVQSHQFSINFARGAAWSNKVICQRVFFRIKSNNRFSDYIDTALFYKTEKRYTKKQFKSIRLALCSRFSLLSESENI